MRNGGRVVEIENEGSRVARTPTEGGSGASIFFGIAMPPLTLHTTAPRPGSFAEAVASTDPAVARAIACGEEARRRTFTKRARDATRLTPAPLARPLPPFRSARAGLNQAAGTKGAQARPNLAAKEAKRPKEQAEKACREAEQRGRRRGGVRRGGGVEAVRRGAQGAARHCRCKPAARLAYEQAVGCSRRRTHVDDSGHARQDVHLHG